MSRSRTWWGIVGVILLFVGAQFASAEPMNGGKAVEKLGRGGVNLVTGWVEIPKRIQETSQTSGGLSGWTWGLLRGLGHGFIRTAGGPLRNRDLSVSCTSKLSAGHSARVCI